MGDFLIQRRHGELEAVVPSSHGGGLVHLRRDDDSGSGWSGPTRFGGRGRYTGTAAIRSTQGNLEVLAIDGAGNLDFFWRLDHAPWTWSRPRRIAAELRGVPSLIQSRHGTRGNFEVVVPHRDGGLAHLWRDNDAGLVWSGPSRFGGVTRYAGATVVQSDHGTPGDLEVLAVDDAGNLDHFRREDHAPWTWSGPVRVAEGLRGTPSLVQGKRFEVVVPHRDGGLAHLWRDDDTSPVWSEPDRFGGAARYDRAALVGSDQGDLEVLAVDDAGNVDLLRRQDHTPWSGPVRVGVEVAFDVRGCDHSWRAAYHQADTHVAVRVRLVPDPGITDATMARLREKWRDAITATWSDRFDCLGGGDRRRITVDVQWVTEGAHHVVRVRPGPARSSMTTWDTEDTGDVAAHEFGHLLGHPDEHATTACPAHTPVGTGTVMDDDAGTVARLYGRIAGLHLGHTPSGGGPSEVDAHVVEPLRSVDLLGSGSRASVLSRLRAVGEADDVEGVERTVVSFEITGGAPGERYAYRIAVSGAGAAERHRFDEFSATPTAVAHARVDTLLAAAVFAAADRAGLLADDPPALAVGDLPPDEMIATLTVRDGNAVRRISAPAAEPRTADGLVDVPLTTHVQLEKGSADVLRPVLEALRAVEASL